MNAKWRWLALLGLASGLAGAKDYCVNGNNALGTALLLSQFTSAPNRILLVGNQTYSIAGTLLETGVGSAYDANGLTIEGGYNSDCSAQAHDNAAFTTLSGAGAQRMNIRATFDFEMSNFTVSNATVEIQGGIAVDSAIRLSHMRFIEDNYVDLFFNGTPGAQVLIDNSVFARMTSTSLPALTVDAQGTNGTASGTHGEIVLVNNTIARNAREGLRTETDAGGTVKAYNNIVWDNATSGSFLNWSIVTTAPLAINNTIGSHNGSYAAGSSGNLSADPLFASTTNYSLQFASPARNAGTGNVPGGLAGVDVEGNPRAKCRVDQGAYENQTACETVIIVTNTNDSGAGSLHQAILDANDNPDYNVIGFNIAGGSCPHNIALTSALPTITDAVEINGYSQAGSAVNTSDTSDNATLCVELSDASSGGIANGLQFNAAGSDTLSVSGLSIGGFTTGVRVSNGGFDLWGNFIGVAANGTTARANAVGVYADGAVGGTLGGSGNQRRNLISGNTSNLGGFGVNLSGSMPVTVRNNYIGTTRSGNAALANGYGIYVASDKNSIKDNLVSGNSNDGINVAGGDFNILDYNRIGVKAFSPFGDPALPNGRDGVHIVGRLNLVMHSTIANNGAAGVSVSSGLSNYIAGNRLYDNIGLPVDLGNTGLDPIDSDTATPNGANRLINRPELGLAPTGGDYYGSVDVTLQSINGSYEIHFFADDSCAGGGISGSRYVLNYAYLTISNATANADGSRTVTLPVGNGVDALDGKFLSAVAIDDAYLNTSEFATCVLYHASDVIFANGFE